MTTKTYTEKLWRPRLFIVVNFIICLTALAMPMALPSTERVAVFVSPWSASSKTMNVISSAGGLMVNSGTAQWVAVAQSSHSDFTARLYSAGALLVIDADFAASCLPRNFFETRKT